MFISPRAHCTDVVDENRQERAWAATMTAAVMRERNAAITFVMQYCTETEYNNIVI